MPKVLTNMRSPALSEAGAGGADAGATVETAISLGSPWTTLSSGGVPGTVWNSNRLASTGSAEWMVMPPLRSSVLTTLRRAGPTAGVTARRAVTAAAGATARPLRRLRIVRWKETPSPISPRARKFRQGSPAAGSRVQPTLWMKAKPGLAGVTATQGDDAAFAGGAAAVLGSGVDSQTRNAGNGPVPTGATGSAAAPVGQVQFQLVPLNTQVGQIRGSSGLPPRGVWLTTPVAEKLR